MTEYDYSPEAYDRYMATRTRISNWVDDVSHHSKETPSQFSSPTSSDHHRYGPPPAYPQQHPHSRTHSRSNSSSRPHSHEQYFYNRESSRPRSRSQTNARPQASRSYTTQPMHSRTYSYAMNQPPPPVPMLMQQPPLRYPYPAPRRSQTLPHPHNVMYQSPHGGSGYVIVPPAVAGAPAQIRMQSAVRILHSCFVFFSAE
ncbi:hypothetical protein BC826DRAFT_1044925 [Russula brevipes]|nr:hypothetical protein BC826DRAFT_1044925 [Russula brevipes]